MISIKAIEQARNNLADIINPTPLQFSKTFTEMTGTRVHLKPECLQKNGSFKIRGAFTMLNSMTPEEQQKGVVTFSAGNWAQGVAYAAALLHISATIILPEWVNRKKAEATRGYGAKVIIYGTNSQELAQRALQIEETEGATHINPFNNMNMITGTATIGMEIIEEKPDTDVIIVPIGGGALIAGIAMGAKLMKPDVTICGVQATGANAIYRSIQAGKVVELEKVETIADGLAVSKPDERAVEWVKEYVDEIVQVSEDEIRHAVFLLLERAKLVVEPAGATVLAALLTGKISGLKNKETVLTLTGGNIDLGLLSTIIQESIQIT